MTAHPIRRDDRSTVTDQRSNEMFENVYVGVKDVEAGRDALALARQLVSPDGDLTLVSVFVAVNTPPPDGGAGWEVGERRRALARLARLRDDSHVGAELSWLQARSAAAGLSEVVRGHGDLLVVGASRRDDYERVFVGDDAREVLEHAPSAVAVAPAGYAARAGALRVIGVAYDGSPAGEQALDAGRRLASARAAELSVFQVVPEPIRVRDPWHVEAEIAAGVERAGRRLAELEGVTTHAVSGDPADELARLAASVDLMVLGPHTRRPVDRLAGGSVAQRLADTIPCPLLVLGPPATGS
jgi:nucleotide-binding universal stress UspA family protein